MEYEVQIQNYTTKNDMNKMIEISQALNNYRNKEVSFRVPVKAKLPFGSFLMYAVKKVENAKQDKENGIYLLDGAGEWHGPLYQSQMNAEFIIHALYNRIVQHVKA